MKDFLIYESGNGGELSLTNDIIEETSSIFNQIYLTHFGGNVEASTTGNEREGEERLDWWGNEFLNTDQQMNSSLEKALIDNALTSAGRSVIEQAAKSDVEFLENIADISTNVYVTGNDKVVISHIVDQKVMNFIWDATNAELIEEITI